MCFFSKLRERNSNTGTIEDNKHIDKLILGIAPMLVGVILLCVYFIHDVYPFGTRSIAYYDMAQSFVPLYYHTWDVLHGTKQLFFDWNIGMGCSLADVAGAFTLFPSNLFFLFVRRENILYSMSIFLMLKMMFCAFSMSFYISKNRCSRYLVVYAGVAYAFSGYVLQYYTNIYFLDVVMIFPLLIWAMKRVIVSGKKLAYIILLSLVFLANQQLAFMVVIYIIFKGWFETRKIDKEEQGRAIQGLVLSSIAGFMISAFSFIPSFIQMIRSFRFEYAMSSSLMDKYMTTSCEFFEHKLFMLYGCEIGLGCFIYLVLNSEKRKKAIDKLYMVLLLGMPIIFENINILWHGGSYQHFPMRFGYMLSFELIGLICFTLDVEVEDNAAKTEKQTAFLVSLCALLANAFMIIVICTKFRQYGIREQSAYRGYGFIILGMTLFGIAVSCIYSKRIKIILLCIMTLISVTSGAYGLIAPYGVYSPEGKDDLVRSAELVRDNIELLDSTNRIKDINQNFNTNFGFTLGQSSLGCWMNGVNPFLQEAMIKMGYTAHYTRVMGAGGTVFSDALLGVKRVYATCEANPTLYTNRLPVGDGGMYDCRYSFPFGVLVDRDGLDGVSVNETNDLFAYQNDLFTAITGIQDSLIEEIDIAELYTRDIYDEDNGVYMYDMDIEVDKDSVLYMYAEREYNILSKFAVIVDEEQIEFDAQGSAGNMMYATLFLNGFVELGTYANQTVNLKILSEFDDLGIFHVGLLDLDLLDESIDIVNDTISSLARVERGKLKLDISANKSGTLFLPIEYYDDYKILVDGQNSDYFALFDGTLLGISIEKGHHELEIGYIPYGTLIGVIVSLMGVIVAICLVVIRHRAIAVLPNNLWVIAYKMLMVAMVVVMYFISVVAFTCEQICLIVMTK